MGHRTQITLTDEQYAMLKRESERTGLGLAELVRRALSVTYRTPGPGSTAALDESFGAWTERGFDGAEYVERLRPGLGRRLPA
jgi:ribbon-helix-helix protein